MKKNKKRDYSTPLTNVMEVKSERILCGSPQFNSPYSGNQDW